MHMVHKYELTISVNVDLSLCIIVIWVLWCLESFKTPSVRTLLQYPFMAIIYNLTADESQHSDANAGRGGLNLWPGYTWQALFLVFISFALTVVFSQKWSLCVGLCGGVWQEDKDMHTFMYSHTHTLTHSEPDSLVKMVVEMQCNQSDVLYTTSHVTWNLQTLYVCNFLALKLLTLSRRRKKLVRGNS